MGIETSAEHGGAESSFTSAIIAIEELAKVDPSVSVLCDVHNTLVNTIFRTYGTKEQQDKWLPLLSENKVKTENKFPGNYTCSPACLAWVILSVGTCLRLRCIRFADTC
jgi:Acyl-CoA dehydrogenase, N-terminal domain